MTDNKLINEFEESIPGLEQPEDFLSPDQRSKAIAEVLAAMALDVVRKSDQAKSDNDQCSGKESR